MSRSYHKSNTDKYAFINCVAYFSNKKSKRFCNRKFRTISKRNIIKYLKNDNLENYLGPNKTCEVMSVYDFASDGLRSIHFFNNNTYRYYKFSEIEIKKLKRK